MNTSCHSVESYPVKFQDCDPSGRIHLHRLMDYAQDCDDRNCRLLGVDGKSLLKHKACWIMVGYAIRLIAGLPGSDEILVVDSWSRGLDGIRFYRENNYYLGKQAEANLIGMATSEWILASTDRHRPLRPAAILDPDEFNALSDPRVANLEIIERLSPPANPPATSCCLDYRIGLGDLDLNIHLHNTHYARLAVDAAARLVKLDPRRQYLQISSFHIQYNAEVHYNDRLIVTSGFDPCDPSLIHIAGRLEDGAASSFLARMTYRLNSLSPPGI
ncbi:MAG TPA: thioesterase [Bacillota bacterium]|jgi:acyl-ACP thioesterase|nr:hypothetical protein [Fastidiosipila sp.]HPX93387.1 thioesterase [Bacillota bacterium]HQB80475.1 thioesterase [Bacillota bacterium]